MLRLISERKLGRTWDENELIKVCGSSPVPPLSGCSLCRSPYCMGWTRVGTELGAELVVSHCPAGHSRREVTAKLSTFGLPMVTGNAELLIQDQHSKTLGFHRQVHYNIGITKCRYHEAT